MQFNKQKLLTCAIKLGKIEFVEWFVNHQFNVDLKQIVIAIALGYEVSADLLYTKANFNVPLQDQILNNMTSYHKYLARIISKADLNAIKWLLDRFSDIIYPMHHLIIKYDQVYVYQYVTAGPYHYDLNINTGYYSAILDGSVKMIEYIHNLNKNIAAICLIDNIQQAVNFNHIKVIQWYLNHGLINGQIVKDKLDLKIEELSCHKRCYLDGKSLFYYKTNIGTVNLINDLIQSSC